LNKLTKWQNPTNVVLESGEEELKARLRGLQNRYGAWWNDHYKRIQGASNDL
jgi:hypothetical protein